MKTAKGEEQTLIILMSRLQRAGLARRMCLCAHVCHTAVCTTLGTGQLVDHGRSVAIAPHFPLQAVLANEAQ